MTEEIQEPPEKKMKSENNSKVKDLDDIITKIKTNNENLEPVMHKDFAKSIPLVNCYVGTIKNLKDISKTITKLNEKVPLKHFQHLKRVRNKKVLLCTLDNLNGATINEYLSKADDSFKDNFEDIIEIEVPSIAPQVRSQFEVANEIWPCNFYPNKYNEKLVSGDFFNDKELKIHRQFMALAFEVAKYYANYNEVIINKLNVAIVVDPITQSVVAIAADERDHPLKHATMLAIDRVAATQNGGAWINFIKDDIDVKLRGINKELYEYLKEKFEEFKFGARKFEEKKDRGLNNDGVNTNDGPYLCTGYYMYMLREPCIMCAMASVHARMKRIFFCYDDIESGALKSKVRLHTLPSLNHHYEVFTGFHK